MVFPILTFTVSYGLNIWWVALGLPHRNRRTQSGPKLKCHRPLGGLKFPENMSLLDKTILVVINVDFLW